MDFVSISIGAFGGLIVGGILMHLALLSRTRDAAARAQELESRLRDVSESLTAKAEETARLAATIAERDKAHEERLKAYEDAEQRLKDTFEALSAKALRESAGELAKQADEVLKRYKEGAEGDLKARQQAIDALLKPMKETLDKLEETNQSMERRRSGAYAELMEQVKALNEQQSKLHAETGRLVKALQDPGSAGSWGEMVLERVLELSGLEEGVNFYTQQTTDDGEERQRPDVHVRLPGGRLIIIDSKAPMRNYLEALGAPEGERDALLRAHSAKLLEHSKELRRRDYSKHADALDFTVMFIGSEAAFRAAMEARPNLTEEVLSNNVVVATPWTLLALLRAIAYGWRQERLAEAAREVQEDGRRLYETVCKLMDHYARLGKALGQAGRAYNDFGGSLETRVLPAARRFKDAGVQSSAELEPFEPLEFSARALNAAEFEPGADALPSRAVAKEPDPQGALLE